MNEFLKILKEMKDECEKRFGNKCEGCPYFIHRCQSLDSLAYNLTDFPINLKLDDIETDIKEFIDGKRW